MIEKTANTRTALAASAWLTPTVRGRNHGMDEMEERIRCGDVGSLAIGIMLIMRGQTRQR